MFSTDVRRGAIQVSATAEIITAGVPRVLSMRRYCRRVELRPGVWEAGPGDAEPRPALPVLPVYGHSE